MIKKSIFDNLYYRTKTLALQLFFSNFQLLNLNKTKTNTMKKLLLASIIMIGMSHLATAQNAELQRHKKEAAKKEANQPAFTNSSNEAVPAKVATTTEEKTDAEIAAKEAKALKPSTTVKTETVAVKEVKEKKEAKQPAAKKTKGN